MQGNHNGGQFGRRPTQYGQDSRRPAGQRTTAQNPRGQSPNGQSPRGQNPGGTRRVDRSQDFARRQAEYQRRRAYEAEMARRREAEKRRRKAERRRAWKIFWGRALVFLILFALLAVLAVVGFVLHFNKTNAEKEPTNIRYFYGGAEGDALAESLSLQDGVLYVDFTAVAEYLELTQIGGADCMRFVIVTESSGDSAGDGREEDVIFTANSDLAVVNGQSVRLERRAILSGEHYLVPASFLGEYMQGVAVTQEKNRVDIARTYTGETADEVQFGLKNAGCAEPIPEDTSVGKVDPNAVIIPPVTAPVTNTTPPETEPPAPVEPDITVEFKSDLSEYEQYMNPADRDAYLVLVNYENLLDESYLPADLTDVTDTRKDGRNTQKMVKTAAMALEALFIEMRACCYTDVSVTSAYRSYSYQSSLFNMYTNNEMAANPSLTRAQAEAITETYSARPGTSEHQTGLCCDMHNLASADQAFANKEAYTWLKDNAWKFGFIIRFPEGKEDVTKISFEPWHYRFVGRCHAKAMYDAGLCLEEYLETLR